MDHEPERCKPWSAKTVGGLLPQRCEQWWSSCRKLHRRSCGILPDQSIRVRTCPLCGQHGSTTNPGKGSAGWDALEGAALPHSSLRDTVRNTKAWARSCSRRIQCFARRSNSAMPSWRTNSGPASWTSSTDLRRPALWCTVSSCQAGQTAAGAAARWRNAGRRSQRGTCHDRPRYWPSGCLHRRGQWTRLGRGCRRTRRDRQASDQV